jgi:hypothetical protein
MLTGATCLLLLTLIGTGLFLWGRSRVLEAVYRDRLRQLCDEYEALRSNYNTVVRRTAVAELKAADGKLAIVYRIGGQAVKTVPLPFDPTREIYVDFVVIDGRLLIRRVFSEDTPPNAGVLLNPELLGIDWERPDIHVGKAVYRRLNNGRWAVTVTGNGALGLERIRHAAPGPTIAPAPPVHDYAETASAIQSRTRAISLREVVAALAAGARPGGD